MMTDIASQWAAQADTALECASDVLLAIERHMQQPNAVVLAGNARRPAAELAEAVRALKATTDSLDPASLTSEDVAVLVVKAHALRDEGVDEASMRTVDAVSQGSRSLKSSVGPAASAMRDLISCVERVELLAHPHVLTHRWMR